ncbi:hypothetical protein [Lysobacter capsici]|uniref:hypothetical protein n=1 Tax=Lysobacter capsici TaxID=435897 RepID=UPI000716759E|nr:hypothetical protein [Lysobacter capsici]
MSRSGYSDDMEDLWAFIRYRGAVTSGIRGARGQRLLRQLLEALDAMPDKRLSAGDLEKDGCHCALGVIGAARGLDMSSIDPHRSAQVSRAFDIAEAVAREIVFENDENGHWDETPEGRWVRMRTWVQSQLLARNGGEGANV